MNAFAHAIAGRMIADGIAAEERRLAERRVRPGNGGRRAGEAEHVVAPWIEDVRPLREGATLVEWTNPETTDVIGCLYGAREECKSIENARRLLAVDARRLARLCDVEGTLPRGSR